MESVANLPSARARPYCPFCVVLNAQPWPEYADEKLCEAHLPIARALQCKGWNQSRWHQRLAGLARHRLLPVGVKWWPQTAEEWVAAITMVESSCPAGRSPKGDA